MLQNMLVSFITMHLKGYNLTSLIREREREDAIK